MQQQAADIDDREQAKAQAKKILRENSLLLVLNLIIVLLLAFGLSSKMAEVQQCSKRLFWCGVLFEAYFAFFLVRSMIVVGICFLVKKPLSVYWGAQTLFAAIDTGLFTTLVVYAATVLFSDEAVSCRSNELNDSASYWYFVAFCCLVGVLYSLLLVGICCLTVGCFCFIVSMIYHQGQTFRMREAINRVPLAQAAMARIGHTQYKEKSEKSKQQVSCIICLTNFKEDDQVSELNCDERHIFHTQCLQPWLEQ